MHFLKQFYIEQSRWRHIYWYYAGRYGKTAEHASGGGFVLLIIWSSHYWSCKYGRVLTPIVRFKQTRYWAVITIFNADVKWPQIARKLRLWSYDRTNGIAWELSNSTLSGSLARWCLTALRLGQAWKILTGYSGPVYHDWWLCPVPPWICPAVLRLHLVALDHQSHGTM